MTARTSAAGERLYRLILAGTPPAVAAKRCGMSRSQAYRIKAAIDQGRHARTASTPANAISRDDEVVHQ